MPRPANPDRRDSGPKETGRGALRRFDAPEDFSAPHFPPRSAVVRGWSKIKPFLPPLLHVTSLALLFGGILWGLSAMYRTYPQIAASYWRRQLPAASVSSAERILRRASSLGDAGLPVLVEALDAKQPSVAAAAKRQLGALLAHWQHQPAAQRSVHALALVEALAEAVERFGPSAQSDAAELAQQILESELAGTGNETLRILAASEKVIRAHHASPRRGPSAPDSLYSQSSGRGVLPSRGGVLRAVSRDTSSAKTLLADLPPLPGGGLSVGPQMPAKRGSGTESLPPHSRSGALPLRPLAADPQLQKIPTPEQRIVPPPPPTEKNVRALRHEDSLTGSSPPSAPGAPGGPPVEPPRPRMTDSQATYWMRALRSSDPQIVAQAESVLAERGFSAVERDLARRLYDPDRRVRQALAETLPDVPRIDAAAWMFQLCRDDDPEVRWTAYTFLATTPDPRLLLRLESLARRDPDPRIQDLADRLGTRTGAPRR
ncbi:MAG: HEAT repeat domain-containing protein [Pirellulales bacterium]|nr:HEAT repeat domain-containing protein [Pirellulales bacterium]